MKKIFAILMCLCLVFSIVACAAKEEATQAPTNAPTEAPTEAPNNDDNTPKEVEYKLGMGVVVNTGSSKTGTAQVDATVATVVLGADGKIVACRIDVAQNKMNVADGQVELEKTFKTKMELGDDYGMASSPYSPDNNGDGIVKEWYEQALAFEAYVVGKTVAEVEAMTTKEVNGHQISADDALLSAGCTIQIVDFRDAVVKACKDEQGVSFKTASAFTLGVAAKTNVDSATKAATAEEEGVVAMYTDFAACVVADGKILASLNDAIQPKIAINASGEIGDTTFVDTKRCLKEDYNMAKHGASMDNNGDGKVLEWYIQSEAFSKHVVGMTGAEVAGMKTQEVNNHLISTDEALLSAGCTMQITGICAVVAQAAANAR